LYYCQLVFSTHLSHFHFCVEIYHHAFMWRPWLQLNIKVKILDILPYMAWLSFSGGNKHSNSKSVCVVWVGTWKHLRNVPVWVVNKWGLLSHSVFVTTNINTNTTHTHTHNFFLLYYTHTHTHTHTQFLLTLQQHSSLCQ